MMKKILCFFALIFIFNVCKKKNTIDKFLIQSDKAIQNHIFYIEKKERVINNFEMLLQKNSDLEPQFIKTITQLTEVKNIMQIAAEFPLILDIYEEKNILKYLLLIISTLSAFMIFMALWIYFQMKLIKSKRLRLYSLNKELEIISSELLKANETREKHVGLFMGLCSSYISKLEQYKETIRRNMIAHQVEDLYKMGDSPQLIKSELKEFYKNFDKAVLKLFPNFVEKFNCLLKEDAQIHVKKEGELLNTELRIFALIRLGINDSSKIATFLRYSPQTIYNYRTRIKNFGLNGRNNFEKEVMGIN